MKIEYLMIICSIMSLFNLIFCIDCALITLLSFDKPCFISYIIIMCNIFLNATWFLSVWLYSLFKSFTKKQAQLIGIMMIIFQFVFLVPSLNNQLYCENLNQWLMINLILFTIDFICYIKICSYVRSQTNEILDENFRIRNGINQYHTFIELF